MQTPWCTTRSARPCYYCWWHSSNHRWTGTLPIGPPHSTSRKMVLFVPHPWYQRCCQHKLIGYSLTCLAYMIVQDVTALPTFTPHGGTTTHSFTGLKPDSHVHPISKVWSSPEDHVNSISKHVNGTPIFNRNIWSTMLNFIYQLSKHRCMGNVMNNPLPYLKSFLHYILTWISCSAYPWEGYTLEIWV